MKDTGGGAPFCLEGVTLTNPNGYGLIIDGFPNPCSVRLSSCAISDCKYEGVFVHGAGASLELVDCLALRNGWSGVNAEGGARVRISGASSRIENNGIFGLCSRSGSSIKVSGLGTKPALTRQDGSHRYFSGATTSALFSQTEAHPNKKGDVVENGSGSVVFLP